MQGKVHANFGLHVCIRPVVWKENEDKQTDRQTDTPFCVTIIDKLGGGIQPCTPSKSYPLHGHSKGAFLTTHPSIFGKKLSSPVSRDQVRPQALLVNEYKYDRIQNICQSDFETLHGVLFTC